ncbi:MAG: FAD-binding oxidoreductase [Deltaproteobacteria bacterium]|nr:FAD-binding oxidoreductase [Deltaproteobacteria bacterium]MBW2413508.1 FAD-binding oxidoreductase [Deltaproteobacteria bacterium]
MADVLPRLEAELGEIVASDAETLDAHRHDSWMLADLMDLQGNPAPRPLAVVRARSADDVSRTLRLCRELSLPVIPFGGGSGVCGAVEASPEVLVLSTRGLDGLVSLDDESLTAAFRAGTMGGEAERIVQRDGLTIGHWPQSIELSTVGGWVATRAAGQYSTGYGSIEDMVLSLEAVLPDGSRLRTRPTPRASAGPDLRHLLMGSEGTLGVVTEVTFSLRPLPEASQGQVFHFPDLGSGLDPIRHVMRQGWRPPVVRLYDAPESHRHFGEWIDEDRAALVLLHEGPRALVDVELAAVAALCRDAGGVEADAAIVDHWLEHRNNVPSFRELLEAGLVVDTIEVGAVWERIGAVYDAVIGSLLEVPSIRSATAHSSHSYRSGTNLYFTFVARPGDRAEMADVYRECWRRAVEATLEQGGGIAHHHGIGRVRRDFLAREIGEGGVAVLRAVKAALDPQGLLNPGALLPER